MKLKDYFDNWEEIFIGAMLQFPLYFIIGWWVIPAMLVCGLLWRAGGVRGGNKAFRRFGVPIVVTSTTFVVLHEWQIFLAVPFMIWGCPWSYGKESWLFNFIMIRTHNVHTADFLTRSILFAWYWLVFSIALML
jgi:hypothetical protein